MPGIFTFLPPPNQTPLNSVQDFKISSSQLDVAILLGTKGHTSS